MQIPFSRKKHVKDIILLLLLCAILLFFSFSRYLSKENENSSLEEVGKNAFYQELPEQYAHFLGKESLDSVLGSDPKIRQVKKLLKFDVYLAQNELYRELILMRRVKQEDTLETKTIKFNIYPVYQEFTKGNYITLQSNTITYYHDRANYEVVRQVIPNIAIAKIICYTQNWQSLVNKVDNSTISPKNAEHIANTKQKNKDSLAIGLDPKTSVYEFMFEKELRNNTIPYMPFNQNFKKTDILNASELFKTFARERNLSLIHIPNDISFWENLTLSKKIPEMDFLNTDDTFIVPRLRAYIEGAITFGELFDAEKLASYYALLNLYSNRLENSLFLNLNSQSRLLEPYFVDKELGELNTYVKNLNLNDIEFLRNYSLDLQQLVSNEFISNFTKTNRDTLRKILEVQQHILPTDLFDKNIFKHNKLIIQKVLNPSTTTKIALVKYDDEKIEMDIENLASFPLEIRELSYKQNKFITSPSEEDLVIMPLEKRKVIFELPDSFDNLFVHKKKKTTGFIFEKDIFDLSVGYRLVETSEMKFNSITPFVDFDELTKEDDLFRADSEISSFDFLSLNEKKKEITFNSNAIILDKPLLFPQGYVIKANPGLNIDIVAGGKIISKSPLNFLGSANHHIKIYSSDGKGQGIFVVSAKKMSNLKYVDFESLTNQSHGLWDLTGAVVFYESPVNLDHVLIANNSCEDGLNIIRTHFSMNNTTFKNTQSDAFDGDFVQGTITNCNFDNLGNDAIDVSGSKLELYNLKIKHAGDKALSAGEDSQLKGRKIIIDSSEIAIAGKDLSIVRLNDVSISNSKLGFTAFKKKPEFGASNIVAENVVMTKVETAHLIENKSSLLLNGEKSATIEQVKEQMYGIEFGVDSKETRVKKIE